MNYWLIKSEPNAYSWDDLVKLGRDHWDGVRNYQARNNLKKMTIGDEALFYHSVNEKAIVGIARVVRDFYPDPTTDDDRWVVVDFEPLKPLKRKVTLEEVKAIPQLSNMSLVKNTRLSVQPVTRREYEIIIKMSEQ